MSQIMKYDRASKEGRATRAAAHSDRPDKAPRSNERMEEKTCSK
jgi:hypothetical protein